MKLRLYLYVLIVGLSCIGVCSAQPGAPAAKAVVIRAGHLLDVKTGKPLTNHVIVSQGDKIASVAPDTQVPAGALVVDLSNATVLCVLIAAHPHLAMDTDYGY